MAPTSRPVGLATPTPQLASGKSKHQITEGLLLPNAAVSLAVPAIGRNVCFGLRGLTLGKLAPYGLSKLPYKPMTLTARPPNDSGWPWDTLGNCKNHTTRGGEDGDGLSSETYEGNGGMALPTATVRRVASGL
jgi:hypothetical protein